MDLKKLKKKGKGVKKSFLKIGKGVILFLAVLGALGFWFGQNTKENKPKVSAVVTHLEKVHETVLMNAGINKVITQVNNTTIPWTEVGIPFTEKRALLVLNYTAKIGIKEAVKVKEVSENTYEITVPEYQVIGVSLNEKEPYYLYDSAGELLSLATANVDTGELVSKALTNEEQQKYLESNRDVLNDSAKTYYETLVKTLNQDAQVTVLFPNQQ